MRYSHSIRRPMLTYGRGLAGIVPGVRWAGIGLAIASANVALGAELTKGHSKVFIALAALPILGGAVFRLILARREVLVYAMLLLATVGANINQPLPGTGGSVIYPADVIVVLAVVSYLATRLASRGGFDERLPRTAVLSWPLTIFALAVLIAVTRGHERYGLSYASQPVRMVIDAGIVTALVGVSVPSLYRAIVVIFYADAIWQAPIGLYHLATGTSQTTSIDLSTGGTRPLALSTAMYLAGAVVLALLNLEFDRRQRRGLHLLIAALSAFGVVIALGRTTFGALAVIVPLLFIGSRQLRWTAAAWLPLAVPVMAVLLVLALQVRPSFGSTLAHRLTGQVGADTSLVQRQRKYDVALEGISKHRLLGFGFGRPVEYVSIDRSIRTFSGDPENSYVWTLAGGGFLALSSLLLLILSFFVDGFRRMLRATGEARALCIFGMALAFVFLFNALTGPILSDPTFMMTIWIAMLLPTVACPSRSTESVGERSAATPGSRYVGRAET